MLALSIRQPWAYLIAAGIKTIEYRSWPTEHRGQFIIHAAKLFDESYNNNPSLFLKILEKRYGVAMVLDTVLSLPRGGIVGQAELIDCLSAHPFRGFAANKQYGFVIHNAMHLNFCPCIGLPRFFDVIPPLEASITRVQQKLFPSNPKGNDHDVDTAHSSL